MFWISAYVAAIVFVNWAFSALPMLEVAGEHLPSGAFLVGFIFVVRDFAQKEVGHKVIAAMLLSGAISYFMADPYVAVASVVAFLISEFIDWAVYSFTKMPFAKRVLLSSAAGTPIDSAIFLVIAGFYSTGGLVIMTIAKMVGALAVWWIVSRREKEQYA